MYQVFYGQHWLRSRSKTFPTKALALKFARQRKTPYVRVIRIQRDVVWSRGS
jgi:hypothetical protein